MELELLGAGGFGGSLTHLGVKKSILVHFWMIFWKTTSQAICEFEHIIDVKNGGFVGSKLITGRQIKKTAGNWWILQNTRVCIK